LKGEIHEKSDGFNNDGSFPFVVIRASLAGPADAGREIIGEGKEPPRFKAQENENGKKSFWNPPRGATSSDT
jgi:hypothetical protein